MRRWIASICVVFLGATIGCRAHQIQHDQDRIRVAIMDMYSNQIMDNLIRAHDGHPFVQVDYTSVTGQITQEANGTLESTFLKGAYSPWNLHLGGNQNNQLSINAAPVLDNDEVYFAYLRFARDPDKFIVSCEAPPKGAAHVCVCCNEQFYWVPTGEADAYQALAMAVTVTRGKNFAIVKDYYVANVVGFLRTPTFIEDEALEANHQEVTNFDYHIELDAEVPKKHAGKVSAVINGAIIEINVASIDEKELVEIQDAKNRNIVRIRDTNVTHHDLLTQLPGQTVKIKLDTIRPSAPSNPEDALKSIQRDVQLFRMNQFLFR